MISVAFLILLVRDEYMPEKRKRNILIVDDDETQRRLYSSEFEDEGYVVGTAVNGTEALEMFEKEDFDLVTLDITMDTTDEGIDVLRVMKEKKPGVPVIMLTAYDFRDDFQVWAADAYIVKSSDLTDLKDRIRELLA